MTTQIVIHWLGIAWDAFCILGILWILGFGWFVIHRLMSPPKAYYKGEEVEVIRKDEWKEHSLKVSFERANEALNRKGLQ